MKSEAPLAARMHPRTLQEHIVGEGKLLRRATEAALECRRLHNERSVLFVKHILGCDHSRSSVSELLDPPVSGSIASVLLIRALRSAQLSACRSVLLLL